MLHVVTTGAYYPPVVTTWKILTTGASQLTAGSLCSGSKFECDRCDFVSDTQHGLKVPMGKSHKNAEVLQDEEHEVSLVLSDPSD